MLRSNLVKLATRSFNTIKPHPKNFPKVPRSVQSMNTLLKALVESRLYDKALNEFKKCRNEFGLVPNEETIDILIISKCKSGDLEGALKLFDEMPELGLVPNLPFYTSVMKACVSAGDWLGVERAFGQILAHGLVPDAVSRTVLIESYVKQRRLSEAEKVVDKMKEKWIPKTYATYRIMISAYCREDGKSGEAKKFLVGMIKAGKYTPSSKMCCEVIDALCRQGKLNEAYDLWIMYVKDFSDSDNAEIFVTLIKWLCKSGEVWKARKLFNELERFSTPTLSVYNSLISGMCRKGEMFEAERLLSVMAKNGCELDCFTYNELITGFCRIGKVQQGLKILGEMIKRGFSPEKVTCDVVFYVLRKLGNEGDLSRTLSLVKPNLQIEKGSRDLYSLNKYI